MTAIVWLISNWRIALAGLAIVGTLMGGSAIYMKGRLDAAHAIEMRAAKRNLDRLLAVQKSDAMEAIKQAAQLKQLKSKVSDLDDYIESLPTRDKPVLDRSDVEQLRKLWD